MKFSFSVLVLLLHFKIINFMGFCKIVNPWWDVFIILIQCEVYYATLWVRSFRLSLINNKYLIRWSRAIGENKSWHCWYYFRFFKVSTAMTDIVLVMLWHEMWRGGSQRCPSGHRNHGKLWNINIHHEHTAEAVYTWFRIVTKSLGVNSPIMSLNSPSLDSEPPLPPPTLDSVLGKLGNPGKYQVRR